MENISSKTVNNSKSMFQFEYLSLLHLILNISLGFLALACTGTHLFNWNQTGSVLDKWLPLTFLGAHVALGVSCLFVWIFDSRHPKRASMSLILHYITTILLSLWPMFLVLLKWPIVSLCLLLAVTILFIYLTYKYCCSSFLAGMFYCFVTLYLITLCVFNFWIVF